MTFSGSNATIDISANGPETKGSEMTALEAIKAILEVQKTGPQLVTDFGRGIDRGIVIGLEAAIDTLESGAFA